MLQHRQRLAFCKDHIVQDFDLWLSKGFAACEAAITLLALSVFAKAFRWLVTGWTVHFRRLVLATQIYLGDAKMSRLFLRVVPVICRIIRVKPEHPAPVSPKASPQFVFACQDVSQDAFANLFAAILYLLSDVGQRQRFAILWQNSGGSLGQRRF